jgi:hypothetical protein
MHSAYVAYWEGRLSLSPRVEDEHLFVGPLAVMTEGRRALVFPSQDGSMPCRLERERNAGLGVWYQWRVDLEPWARFMRHELEVSPNGDGSYEFEIPDDHLLPWPRLRRCDARVDDVLVARREFALRCASVYRVAGDGALCGFLRGVPRDYRRRIPPDVWVAVVRSIREGKGVDRWTS